MRKSMSQNISMYWFDDDPKTCLEEKVRRAAAYYQKKYGAKPNTCLTNSMSGKVGKIVVDDITVRISNYVLPNHFYLGVETEGS